MLKSAMRGDSFRNLPLAAVALGLSTAALFTAPARGAMYDYEYVADKGASANYPATAGSDLTVKIYLEEDSSDGSSLITDNSGLFSAAFTVSSTSGSSTVTAASGNPGLSGFDSSVKDITNPTGFDDITVANAAGGAGHVEEDEFNDSATHGYDAIGALPTATPSGFSGVLLGSVTIHVVDTTSFSINPVLSKSGDGGTTTNDPGDYDLDNNANGGDYSQLYDDAANTSFTVTVTGGTVPEPASVASLAIAGGVALMRRRAAR